MDRLATLTASFRHHLRALNRAPSTIRAYLESVDRFTAWCRTQGLDDPDQVTRNHIRTWIDLELSRLSAQTVVRHYSGIRRWYHFLTTEEEVHSNPTEGIPQPAVPETLVNIPSPDTLRALLKACAGKGYLERRDTALIRLLADGGPRASEVCGLQVADVDLDEQVVLVLGKGRRHRGVPIGRKAVAALDAYLRARSRRRDRDHPALWLGRPWTPLTTSGLRQIIRRRCRQAGVTPPLHPHQLRHYFADSWLRGDGTEGDLMRITGWKSRQMVDRYAAALAASRAREAHRTHSPGDLL